MSLSNKIRGGVLLANAFKERVLNMYSPSLEDFAIPLLKVLWNVKCLLLIARMSK